MGSGKSQGFIYIGLLILIAIIGLELEAVSEVWSQSARREKERQLLFVGGQIRDALKHYSRTSQFGRARFPASLDQLLDDRREPGKQRHHLRRLYADPITGSTDWGLVTLPDGEIVGVYSKSSEAPLKVAGFSKENDSFADGETYSDWKFSAVVTQLPPPKLPGSKSPRGF